MSRDHARIDQWLADQYDHAVEDLVGVLDIEAGLQEVLIESRHHAAVHELGQTLDIEAGLAAILPDSALRAGHDQQVPPVSHDPGTAAERVVAAIPPLQRLALRSHRATTHLTNIAPQAQAVMDGDLDARSIARIRDTVVSIGSFDYPGRITVESARAFNRARNITIGLGEALDRELVLHNRIARHLKRSWDISRALNRADDCARNIGDAFDPDITRDLSRSLDRARDATYALDLSLDVAVDRARQTARNLSSVLDHAIALDHLLDRTRDLITTVSQARALAHVLAEDLVHARDRVLARANARARDDFYKLTQAFARSLDMTSGGPYGLEAIHEELAPVLRNGALNDVTDADLTHADLTSTDLTGLCWTLYGTLWPSSVDVERLLARSHETVPGSGIYIVMPGPTTIRETTWA